MFGVLQAVCVYKICKVAKTEVSNPEIFFIKVKAAVCRILTLLKHKNTMFADI